MERTIKLMVVLVSFAIGAMIPFLPVPAVAGDQVNKMTGSIDMASIVNFIEPSTKLARADSQAGTIVTIGGNTSVVVASRSQTPSSDLERYRMESSPQGRNGIMGRGVTAALRFGIR